MIYRYRQYLYFILHRVKHYYSSRHGAENIMMTNLKCKGEENDLKRCSFNAPDISHCSGAVHLECDIGTGEYSLYELQFINEYQRELK